MMPHMEHDAPQDSGTQQYMSRRERRELARTQRGGGSAEGFNRTMRRIMIWGGGLFVLGLLGWWMVSASKNLPSPVAAGTLSAPVNDADHSVGPTDAKVTLVEYSDFQCPACAAYAPIVTKALAEPELKGKVRFVYRFFPLITIHPNARLSSQAAEAAGLQGKFWEMHDLLFAKQTEWAELSNTGAKNKFADYAAQLGLDKARFLSDIDGSTVKDRVQRDMDSGNASNIQGTPTFYVNGTVLTNPQSYDEFKQDLLTPLGVTASASPNANQ
jgi:protein-disulfide isomerase